MTTGDANAESNAPGLNENHKRHLVTSFEHIDQVLAEVETVMSGADSGSPFSRYMPDVKPVQRAVAFGYIARIRESMRRILGEQHIPISPPVCGALWAVRTHLMLLQNTVEELALRYMRGYGVIPDTAASWLNLVRSELQALMTRLGDYLAQGDGGDIQARLKRLEQTGDEARLLRELDRIVASHGLIECQGAVAMLTERLENRVFEIGIFGRVSSGKSSLLNHLLGGEILPVGVTPVTALPVRIAAGDRAEARVTLAEANPMTIPLTRLAEFCSEQQNPSNSKHVTRIDVRLPARLLREGIAFVDTPGLGSLAVAGAEETIAYLPRCDLGIVLVDAASAITHEDIVVVDALCRAGATAMMLLSKADLLSAPDRQQAAEYAAAQLRQQTGLNLPVHAVSVRGTDVALCDAWQATVLQPLLDTHKESATKALKRKIGGLRETVIAALRQRQRLQEQPGAADTTPRREEALRDLREGDALLDEAGRRIPDLADEWGPLPGSILDAVSQALAAAWKQGKRNEIQPAMEVSDSAKRRLNEAALRVRERMEQLRSRASSQLQSAESATGRSASSAEEMPAPAWMPAPALPEWSDGVNSLQPPLWMRVHAKLLRGWIRRRLSDVFEPGLRQAVGRHAAEVQEWFRVYAKALQKDYTARAELCRARMGALTARVKGSEAVLEKDLRALEEWVSFPHG